MNYSLLKSVAETLQNTLNGGALLGSGVHYESEIIEY